MCPSGFSLKSNKLLLYSIPTFKSLKKLNLLLFMFLTPSSASIKTLKYPPSPDINSSTPSYKRYPNSLVAYTSKHLWQPTQKRRSHKQPLFLHNNPMLQSASHDWPAAMFTFRNFRPNCWWTTIITSRYNITFHRSCLINFK